MEFAQRLAENPSLRISPSTPPQKETAISPRPEMVSPEGANVASKDKPSGNQKQLALAISEADLQASIIDLAHLYGWKCVHFRSVKVQKTDGSTYYQTPVAADSEGFVDLVLIRPDRGGGLGRVVFAELKSERGKVAPAQTEWLTLLKLTQRVEVFLWRPSQWLDGTIEALLR